MADFGERAMWIPGANDHMRTQLTRPEADCDMDDVDQRFRDPSPPPGAR
ncbi:BQ5605_C029g10697 [Microbotryum silenes-dioicae]|uniref:BQ5605_C029g10697 protein n=1 Tax=Microbotryum silenes-dioicae TaxID=796604 RepID=A0A2X0NC18_9BASI|nr:BQ5605_C029g10697 [Microbotryum silenes-dioicae]